MGDLVAKLKADPGSVSWGGGSTGGTDHILAGLIAKAAGVDPTKVNYIAHSGGGEALSVDPGRPRHRRHQRLRGVRAADRRRQAARRSAISSDERLPGIDVPTLKEQGIDVSLVNWRGVFAPPQIRDDDKKALSEAIAKMVESPAWKDTLKKRGWLDLYQPADEFAAFLAEDRAKVETTLKDIGLVQ